MQKIDRRRALVGAGQFGLGACAGAIWSNWSWDQPAIAGQPQSSQQSAEARVRELKLELPTLTPSTKATLVPAVRVGNLLFVSGHGPQAKDGKRVQGKVGADLTTAEANAIARGIGLTVLSVVRSSLGSLDNVVRLVKVLGMVNAVPDFAEQPQVINGFSDLMVEVFGQPGKGARSAVGMGSLPGNIPVEIEAIFEVRG